MKTAVNLVGGLDLSVQEHLGHAANAGFDGFFPGWRGKEQLSEAVALGRSFGLIPQSVHAPFGKVNLLWESADGGEEVLKTLFDCLEGCAENSVSIMIAHAYIGFGPQDPTALGVERFGRLLDRAAELGITVAVENTEGEEYLERIFADLGGHSALGFCIDTGHEVCYNRSRDLIGRYSAYLAATHFNDNLGVLGEDIDWRDDVHLLPFDGVADWEGIARRLAATPFRGMLTFELKLNPNPGREHAHDRYRSLSPAEYYRLAHDRAERLSALLEKEGFVQKF